MDNLIKLHSTFNQSPWLDNLSRDLIESGQLKQYISGGIRGITSNPTILEKAITTSSLYDEQIRLLKSSGLSAEQIYWEIVKVDIKAAASLLQPVWEESKGVDGYISLEVSPGLAGNTDATVKQAKELWTDLNLPNLMIKVPATEQGIPAVRALLQEGINVNITLIFSLDHYQQVATAHMETHRPGTDNTARSVASFFVSRVDTEVDRRLEAIGTPEALALKGKMAVAQATLAYKFFLQKIAPIALKTPDSPAIQRLLWASTSTKNPDYDDLLYVRYLLAPYTVNTLPEDTIKKINDHLSPDAKSLSIDDIAQAQEIFTQVEQVGVDMNDVAHTLENEGVSKFLESFDALLKAIEAKE